VSRPGPGFLVRSTNGVFPPFGCGAFDATRRASEWGNLAQGRVACSANWALVPILSRPFPSAARTGQSFQLSTRSCGGSVQSTPVRSPDGNAGRSAAIPGRGRAGRCHPGPRWEGSRTRQSRQARALRARCPSLRTSCRLACMAGAAAGNACRSVRWPPSVTGCSPIGGYPSPFLAIDKPEVHSRAGRRRWERAVGSRWRPAFPQTKSPLPSAGQPALPLLPEGPPRREPVWKGVSSARSALSVAKVHCQWTPWASWPKKATVDGGEQSHGGLRLRYLMSTIRGGVVKCRIA
jgi:hypothetical protein